MEPFYVISRDKKFSVHFSINNDCGQPAKESLSEQRSDKREQTHNTEQYIWR